VSSTRIAHIDSILFTNLKVSHIATNGHSIGKPHIGLMTMQLLLFDNYGFFVGRRVLRDDGLLFMLLTLASVCVCVCPLGLL
jgi:hypothetical protein